VLAGHSAWAVQTLAITANDREPLVELASDMGLPAAFVRPDLVGLIPFAGLTPDANGATHSLRREIFVPGGAQLAAAGVRLFLCERERDDAPKLWLVRTDRRGDRFWSARHLALLDGCQQAGLSALKRVGRETLLQIPGAYPPLATARWLRLATGRSSGPASRGYVYAGSDVASRELRRVLGNLVSSEPSARPSFGRAQRVLGGFPSLARATETGACVDAVWRWARDRR
jgi:hypothetical protein